MRTTRTLAATAVARRRRHPRALRLRDEPGGQRWVGPREPARQPGRRPARGVHAGPTGATAAARQQPAGDPDSDPDPDPAGADVRDTGDGHGVHGRGVRHR